MTSENDIARSLIKTRAGRKIEPFAAVDAKLAAFYNPSGIAPTEFKVLILPKAVEKKSKGGIIVPDEIQDREQFAQQEGTIVAMSRLAFTYASADEWGDTKPKVGDVVSYARYAGALKKGKDGKEYRIVNDKDIFAVLT